jgi:hypothetical protein
MTRREAVVAWRLFELNWIALAGMCAAFMLVVSLSTFSFEPVGLAICFAVIAVYAGFAYLNAKLPHRRDPMVVFTLGATAQLALVIVIMGPLTYLAAAADFPMQDANLHAIDLMLGLNWRAYLDFVNAHPLLAEWLSAGYAMIKWPILGIPVVLAMAGRFRRLQEFTLAFSLALIVTTIVSALVPAIGTYYQLGLTAADYPNLYPRAFFDQLRDLPLVRDGTLRHLDLFALAGIVTFPSFHAASAGLYAWAFWGVRWTRPIAIIVNGAMLAGTPIQGGHYFIDVIGGLAVTVLALLVARMVSRVVERRIAAVADSVAAQPTPLADIRNAPSLIAQEQALPREDRAPLAFDHAGRAA